MVPIFNKLYLIMVNKMKKKMINIKYSKSNNYNNNKQYL